MRMTGFEVKDVGGEFMLMMRFIGKPDSMSFHATLEDCIKKINKELKSLAKEK